LGFANTMISDAVWAPFPVIPRKAIPMKFGTGVGLDVNEVVAWAEFDLKDLRVVNFTSG